MTHADLVKRAGKWLKSFGCGVVLEELVSFTPSGENPDAIGWKNGFSILIECKTSRADFHADKKKPFRDVPAIGIGATRFYMCPEGVIKKEDLPDGWGLLWVCGKTVRRVVGPKSNCLDDSTKTFIDRSMMGEVALLVSALRRAGQAKTDSANSDICVNDKTEGRG